MDIEQRLIWLNGKCNRFKIEDAAMYCCNVNIKA